MLRRPIYSLPLLLFCLCLCGSFLLSTTFSPRAFAAGSPITITYQTDSIHFPNYIDFTAIASDAAAPISQATFFITFKDTPDAIAEQQNVPVTPGRSVTLHWRENTSGSNFHSPGTPVEYYWELQDSSNNQYSEAPQDFTTVDTRFSWQHLSQGLLQVNWYNRPLDFGQTVFNRANTSLQHISQNLGGGLLHPVNLWIYANNEDFHGALAPNSYEWVGGEAHPYLNEAFISVTDSQDITLQRDMPHELTHLVFHQLIAQGPLAPTWFDEGLAVYNQLYHEPEMTYRLSQALASHTLLRLSQISNGFPADADQAYLAYAQSWNLVSYMYITFRQAKMAQLIKQMNNPQTGFGEDLTQVLGEDELHLENQWRLHLNQPSILSFVQATATPAPPIQSSQPQSTLADSTEPLFIALGALLILLPLIGIVAIFAYQKRRRQQYAAFPFAAPEQAPGRPPVTNTPSLPQTPVPAPGTPGTPWQDDYLAIPRDGRENDGLALFGPYQENINQQPGQKAPQE